MKTLPVMINAVADSEEFVKQHDAYQNTISRPPSGIEVVTEFGIPTGGVIHTETEAFGNTIRDVLYEDHKNTVVAANSSAPPPKSQGEVVYTLGSAIAKVQRDLKKDLTIITKAVMSSKDKMEQKAFLRKIKREAYRFTEQLTRLRDELEDDEVPAVGGTGQPSATV